MTFFQFGTQTFYTHTCIYNTLYVTSLPFKVNWTSDPTLPMQNWSICIWLISSLSITRQQLYWRPNCYFPHRKCTAHMISPGYYQTTNNQENQEYIDCPLYHENINLRSSPKLKGNRDSMHTLNGWNNLKVQAKQKIEVQLWMFNIYYYLSGNNGLDFFSKTRDHSSKKLVLDIWWKTKMKVKEKKKLGRWPKAIKIIENRSR